MKLSTWAAKRDLSYKTAWRYFKNGQLKGYQTATGTIIITEEEEPNVPEVGLSEPQVKWVSAQAKKLSVSAEEIVRRAMDWYILTYPSSNGSYAPEAQKETQDG